MTIDIRCPSKKFAVLVDENTLEIKCSSRFCGAKPGVVVLHRYNTQTGELLDTSKYKDPERKTNGIGNSTSVRTA